MGKLRNVSRLQARSSHSQTCQHPRATTLQSKTSATQPAYSLRLAQPQTTHRTQDHSASTTGTSGERYCWPIGHVCESRVPPIGGWKGGRKEVSARESGRGHCGPSSLDVRVCSLRTGCAQPLTAINPPPQVFETQRVCRFSFWRHFPPWPLTLDGSREPSQLSQIGQSVLN